MDDLKGILEERGIIDDDEKVNLESYKRFTSKVSVVDLADYIESRFLENQNIEIESFEFLEDVNDFVSSKMSKRMVEKTRPRGKRRKKVMGITNEQEPEDDYMVDEIFPPDISIGDEKEYQERKDRGLTLSKYGNLEMLERDCDCKVEILERDVKQPFYYMYDEMSKKSDILANHVISLAEKLQQIHKFPDFSYFEKEIGVKAYYFGRILCDSVGGNSKLNRNSILLEGFLDDGHTKSSLFHLDLTQLQGSNQDIWLFPGQVVAFQGLVSGDKIQVFKFYTDLNPEQPKLDVTQNHCSMIVACGPYTPVNSLSYAPFADLIDVVKEKKPQVLVLLGPFIDQRHHQINDCKLEVSYRKLFEQVILQKLKDLTCEIIIAPSLNDIHHDYVFPQPEFDRRNYRNTTKNMHFVSNPSLFKVNGIVFGASSENLMYYTSVNHYNPSGKPSVPKIHGAFHMVNQESFYPTHMPTSEVPFDYSNSEILNLPLKPHVLINPTNDKSFVQFAENDMLVLNPYSLVRDKSGATYMHIQFKPRLMNDSQDSLHQENVLSFQKLSNQNVAVEIINI